MEKEDFWNDLDEMVESVHKGERVLIGSDLNGHVGEENRGDEEVMGRHGFKERNLEGQMVVDFAKRMQMAVLNTYFKKKEEQRVTYKSGETFVRQPTRSLQENCSEVGVALLVKIFPTTGVNTNTVEGLWRLAKERNREKWAFTSK